MEFIENATNVYRTKKYIVVQIIDIEYHQSLNNNIYSQDTYYRRTKKRDKYYEKTFVDKININGKRLHSTSYSRKYID